jgi:signal transduction histidine kinase
MKNIRSKILVTYIGVTILALILSWFFTSVRISDYLEEITKEKIKSETKEILQYINIDTASSYDAMYHKIHMLAEMSDIRISLIDEKGKVIFDSDVERAKIGSLENHLSRSEILDAQKNGTGTSKRFSNTIQKMMIYYAQYFENPLNVGGYKGIKYIRTSTPILTFSRLGSELKFILAISGLLSLLIIFITSLKISEWVSKPLRDLKDFALDLKNGIYKNRYPIKHKDEIGILAETMNQLAEKIEAEKSEVERLEGIKREFLTNMTHELRTPLFVIESSLETLQDMDHSDINILKEFIDKASNQTKRLHQVVDNLILISKLRSGEQQPSLRLFKINELAKKTYEKYSEEATRKKIIFEFRCDLSDDVKILGDRQLLSYAIDNLMDNALKFTGDGGKVEMSLEESNNFISFIVSDTGKGLSNSDLKNITEYFYRPDKDHNTKSGGAGLGLAIVKQIIKLHEGTLIIQSELSKGSKFGFNLKKK